MSKHKKYKYPDGYVEECKGHRCSKSSKSSSFTPVSMILSTSNNQILTIDTFYDIKFNIGIVEGKGISISKDGLTLTFDKAGSYRFEIYGDVNVFSDVEIKLIFSSPDMPEEMKYFSQLKLNKQDSKVLLQGISTILPLNAKQNITVKLLPNRDENVLVAANTRLSVYRVA